MCACQCGGGYFPVANARRAANFACGGRAWVYQQSSGSDDVHLLAAALMGFAFAAFMQLFPRPVAAAAYALNLAVLLVACALVSLDGSLWAAACSGYPLPLLAVCLAHLPVLFWLRPLCRQPAHQSD